MVSTAHWEPKAETVAAIDANARRACGWPSVPPQQPDARHQATPIPGPMVLRKPIARAAHRFQTAPQATQDGGGDDAQ